MTASQDSWADTETAGPPDPRRWLALTVVLIASFMDLLDGTNSSVNVIVAVSRRETPPGR